MQALIADVCAGCAAMFRISRDVRFSKDTSPYKTAAISAFYSDGDKTRPGVLSMHSDPKAAFIASGFYHPERDALVAIRAAIAASTEFGKCVATLEKRGHTLGTRANTPTAPGRRASVTSNANRSLSRVMRNVPPMRRSRCSTAYEYA